MAWQQSVVSDRSQLAESFARRRRWLRLFFLLAAVSLAGCGGGAGGDAPAMFPVSGTVTIDGEPLAQGSIVFDPADQQGLPAQGGIQNGSFTLEATPGEKIVRIQAVEETGETGQYGEPITKSIIPVKYNTESTLTATVNSAPTEVKFELNSK